MINIHVKVVINVHVRQLVPFDEVIISTNQWTSTVQWGIYKHWVFKSNIAKQWTSTCQWGIYKYWVFKSNIDTSTNKESIQISTPVPTK